VGYFRSFFTVEIGKSIQTNRSEAYLLAGLAERSGGETNRGDRQHVPHLGYLAIKLRNFKRFKGLEDSGDCGE
jgi:hypothetical protein